jgi:hypothetical protein
MNCDGTRAHLFLTLSTFPQRVLPSASRTRADARVNRNIKPAATNHQLLKITARAPHCGPNRLRLSPTYTHTGWLLIFTQHQHPSFHRTPRAKLLLLRKLKSLPENPRARLDCTYLRRAARQKLNCVFSELLCGAVLTPKEHKVPGNSIKLRISRAKHAWEVFCFQVELRLGNGFLVLCKWRIFCFIKKMLIYAHMILIYGNISLREKFNKIKMNILSCCSRYKHRRQKILVQFLNYS